VTSVYRDETATSDTLLARMARVDSAFPVNSSRRRFAPIGRGFVLVGFGRLSEVQSLVDTVAALSPGAAVGLLGYPIVLGIAPPSFGGARLTSLLSRDLDAAASPRKNAYVEATRAMVRGQTEEAIRRASEGMKLPDESPDSAMNRALLEATVGWARLVRGDTAGGINALRSGLAGYGRPNANETALLRFQLALALAANEDSREEGISHLRYGFDNSAPYLIPLAYLALGRTYEAAEKADSAAMAYGRFVRLWDKADPGLQGRVTDAREALERLTSEPR
jgi:hypothetical protein